MATKKIPDNKTKPGDKNTRKKIIIEGLTKKGQKFRPSNWAERMSGSLSTFRDRRIHYDPRMTPMTNEDGNKCVLLDPELADTNPDLYNSILEFAKKNDLRICNQDAENTTDTNNSEQSTKKNDD